MTTNTYFNLVNNVEERKLYEDLMIENIQLFGIDMYYLPRTVITMDVVLGEDVQTLFQNAYRIEMLMPDGGSFGGDQNIMSKFGFMQELSTSLYVARRRFLELGIKDYIRPREGDLIWIGDLTNPVGSYTNTMFEINQVWHGDTEKEFHFGKELFYRLMCTTFTFSWEHFRTGMKAVDVIDAEQQGALTNQDPSETNDAAATEAPAVVNFDIKNPFGNF